MQVFNCTKDVIIADHVEMADSAWSRFIGLLGKKTLPPGQGLWLEKCASIHTCFMQFPIDVIFLDKNRNILKWVSALPAWRFSAAQGAHAVLELPADTLSEKNCVPGDKLEIRS